jgi:hypothetical protein
MKLLTRFGAVILTAALVLGVELWLSLNAGYAFSLFVLSFAGIVLLGTIIIQVILFFTLRKCKSLLHDFFFFSSFTSSVALVLIYYFYSLVLDSLNSLNEIVKLQYSDEIQMDTDGAAEVASASSSGFSGMHLFLLAPIVIQIILTVYRFKRLKLLSEDISS